MASAVRKKREREREKHRCLAHFRLAIHSGNPSQRMEMPAVMVGAPSSVHPIQSLTHRDTEGSISMVIV